MHEHPSLRSPDVKSNSQRHSIKSHPPSPPPQKKKKGEKKEEEKCHDDGRSKKHNDKLLRRTEANITLSVLSNSMHKHRQP